MGGILPNGIRLSKRLLTLASLVLSTRRSERGVKVQNQTLRQPGDLKRDWDAQKQKRIPPNQDAAAKGQTRNPNIESRNKFEGPNRKCLETIELASPAWDGPKSLATRPRVAFHLCALALS